MSSAVWVVISIPTPEREKQLRGNSSFEAADTGKMIFKSMSTFSLLQALGQQQKVFICIMQWICSLFQ